jgi:saccharopine dehydrogenase-like NADP-dependent oxidoreductase
MSLDDWFFEHMLREYMVNVRTIQDGKIAEVRATNLNAKVLAFVEYFNDLSPDVLYLCPDILPEATDL